MVARLLRSEVVQSAMSWLDIKLGLRMLLRYPGLTIVGGLAMAFAIATGASVFEFLNQMAGPRLPLQEGDRIVGVQLWQVASQSVDKKASFDFAVWRREVISLESVAAFRTVERNLLTADGRIEPVRLAEITASGFKVARVATLLGRPLVDADEHAGAPPVVVIGYEIWQSRFGGDRAVVGQTVRLGSEAAAVVGVMPQGFSFPVSHDAWVPFRLNFGEFNAGQGPEINVFGRLASGAGIEEAQAELTAIGTRLSAGFPDTHEHLRPEVLPYAASITGVRQGEAAVLLAINVVLIMLLVLVSGNVALLMFARAATRESEIVVRTALGAGRGRIIAQLFAEALVLAAVAAPAGLGAAGYLLRWWLQVAQVNAAGRLPFWFTNRLSSSAVLYALVLAFIAAIVSGVVPALKMTGRSIESRLRQTAAGAAGLRFGGVWTAVIVIQVAVTVAFPATVFFVRRAVVEAQTFDVGFRVAEFLSARLELDRERTDVGSVYEELERRLVNEAGVAGVTFTSRLPGTVHSQRWVEVNAVDGADLSASDRRHRVNTVSVALNYFDVLGAPVLSGRAFRSTDLASDAGPVIVNQSFVRQILQDRSAIGRRVRYLENAQGTWLEIVGVVPDLGTMHDNIYDLAAVYRPAAPATISPSHIALHVYGEPGTFTPRLRAVAAAIDPTFRVHDIVPLNSVGAEISNEFDFLWRLLAIMSSLAIVLSLAGIYAAVSFTVSRRRREIGVRVALGARPRSIVTTILRRPLAQVGAGIVAGAALVIALTEVTNQNGLSLMGSLLVLMYAAFMMGVCMLACVVPIARALRIDPNEVLRADG
jgi:predicted permease